MKSYSKNGNLPFIKNPIIVIVADLSDNNQSNIKVAGKIVERDIICSTYQVSPYNQGMRKIYYNTIRYCVIGYTAIL